MSLLFPYGSPLGGLMGRFDDETVPPVPVPFAPVDAPSGPVPFVPMDVPPREESGPSFQVGSTLGDALLGSIGRDFGPAYAQARAQTDANRQFAYQVEMQQKAAEEARQRAAATTRMRNTLGRAVQDVLGDEEPNYHELQQIAGMYASMGLKDEAEFYQNIVNDGTATDFQTKTDPSTGATYLFDAESGTRGPDLTEGEIEYKEMADGVYQRPKGSGQPFERVIEEQLSPYERAKLAADRASDEAERLVDLDAQQIESFESAQGAWDSYRDSIVPPEMFGKLISSLSEGGDNNHRYDTKVSALATMRDPISAVRASESDAIEARASLLARIDNWKSRARTGDATTTMLAELDEEIRLIGEAYADLLDMVAEEERKKIKKVYKLDDDIIDLIIGPNMPRRILADYKQRATESNVGPPLSGAEADSAIVAGLTRGM